MRRLARIGALALASWAVASRPAAQPHAVELPYPTALVTEPCRLDQEPDADGRAAFWLPPGADALVLPCAGGLELPCDDPAAMRWLAATAPFELVELPLLGARYGDRMLVLILPWPQYATLQVGARIGVVFDLPAGRRDAAPCALLACATGPEPLALAGVFRRWRRAATPAARGLVPPVVTLADKIARRPRVGRLLGAAHVYLWGGLRFSHHDVDRSRWPAVARALRDAPADSALGRCASSFDAGARDALADLATADHAEDWLTRTVAAAIDAHLGAPAAEPGAEQLAALLPAGVHPPATWGDGLSRPLLDALRGAGVERALLLTSDLPTGAVRGDVVEHADRCGYLLGCYDSYHSVHAPDAPPDLTWATAQFDSAAYELGRIVAVDGRGSPGFRGRGFHFAPTAAQPYVQSRIGALLARAPFSAWFLDCDATAECFDDYSPAHPATRADDLAARRHRIAWLGERGPVVGSEGGSVLFADLLCFGHGVDTPYLGHLDPALRDPDSPYFPGRHWPPDTPDHEFRGVPVAPSLRSPWFDPRYRVPLYRAALGDELVATHHASFDSWKLADLRGDRELAELLTMQPPLYHLSRAAWPARRDAIARHLAFFAPLHRELATAPLVAHARLTADGLLQRTMFATPTRPVTITVNFAREPRGGFPPRSATVGTADAARIRATVFRVGG
ncbi:MAG: hypothetical protein IPM29_19490 [Planctomycetes bacterium]|nr:hypothetical protein [Planctomycetota bacterium]